MVYLRQLWPYRFGFAQVFVRISGLKELMLRHRWTRNGFRTNTDLREENRAKDKAGRTWLIKGPYSNTLRGEHPIVAHDRSEINCNT